MSDAWEHLTDNRSDAERADIRILNRQTGEIRTMTVNNVSDGWIRQILVQRVCFPALKLRVSGTFHIFACFFRQKNNFTFIGTKKCDKMHF